MDSGQLATVPLFATLGRRKLERLGQWTDEIHVDAGTQLTKQAGFAHEFAIIVDGAADVVIDGEKILRLGPGDFFGEISLLGESPRRTADVVATTSMRLIVMFGRDFRHMRRELPEVAQQIETVMAERLARPLHTGQP